jgi:hypothetical protein
LANGSESPKVFDAYVPNIIKDEFTVDPNPAGNCHEKLNNAVLSPSGYYTGFFHKDFEGLYAQLNESSLV